MRAATLLTVVRENASTHLFTQVTTNVPADVQDTEQTEPAVTPDQSGAQAAGLPLTPHAVYTSHTIFAPAVSGVLPDIRIGDQLVDPADVDPRTSLAATYTVMLVRRWSWHVEAAAIKPATPFNIGAVNLSLLASYNQQATWLPRITDQTPGATPAAGYDPYRQGETTVADGTYGVGWKTSTRNGYLAPTTITVGVDDAYRIEEWQEQGLISYDTSVVFYVPPVTLAKGDILALQDGSGKRYVVADEVTTMRLYGAPVLTIAKLETPEPASIIYTIPLT